MIAFILFVVSCLSSAYLIYRFEIDLSSWEINLGIFGSLTMNAFIAYYFPLFYIALFALNLNPSAWQAIALLVLYQFESHQCQFVDLN